MDFWEDSIGGDIKTVLFDQEHISRQTEAIGKEIARDYAGRNVLMVGILNGCFPFIADLVRSVRADIEVDFMSVSSYGGGMESSGVVRIMKDLNQSIEGRDVLIIEDIIDTGLTARYLLDNLRTRHPNTLELCALLDKREARPRRFPFAMSDSNAPMIFVVGYGLDYKERYRNLPFIGILKQEVYSRS